MTRLLVFALFALLLSSLIAKADTTFFDNPDDLFIMESTPSPSIGGIGGGDGVISSPPTPVTGLRNISIGNTWVVLVWNASVDAYGNSVAKYILYQNSINIANTSGLGYRSIDLKADSIYTYLVSAVDRSGNIGRNSTALLVKTLPNPTNIFGFLPQLSADQQYIVFGFIISAILAVLFIKEKFQLSLSDKDDKD